MCTRHCWATCCLWTALVFAVIGVSMPWFFYQIAMSDGDVGVASVRSTFGWEGEATTVLSCSSSDGSDGAVTSSYGGSGKDGKTCEAKANTTVTPWHKLEMGDVQRTFEESASIAAGGTFALLIAALVVFFGMCVHVTAKKCHAGAIKAAAAILTAVALGLQAAAVAMFVMIPNDFAQEKQCEAILQAEAFFHPDDNNVTTWCDSFAGASHFETDLILTKMDVQLVWGPYVGWCATTFAALLTCCGGVAVGISRHNRYHHHGSYTYQAINA